ncbi:MAG: hypothetical protein SGPRY_009147 [Prymnesium sp.]
MHLALSLPLLASVLALGLGGFVLLRRRLAAPVELRGRPVLITGGAGGLASHLALAFARHGAIVELWDVRSVALEETSEWLRAQMLSSSQPLRLHTRTVDVASEEAVESAASHFVSFHGVPAVVVNNAAVVYGHSLLDVPGHALRTSLGVNILGYFWVARAFARRVLPSREPCTLVTVGSMMADLPAARLSDYCASKAAVAQLHACLRCELSSLPLPHCLSCLHVQPYLIGDTPLFEGGVPFRYRLFRMLLPPLRAADVAQKIVNAVRSRKQKLILPWLQDA